MEKQFDLNAFYRICEEGKDYVARQINGLEDPRKTQMDFLKKLLKDNENTVYGKDHGFANIQSYEDYKKAVPLTVYDNYAPGIEQMLKSPVPINLFTEHPVLFYATSSGSTGVPKNMPVTKNGLEFFSAYSGSVILYHLGEQIKKQDHTPGHICFLMDLNESASQNGYQKGPISSQTAYNFIEDIESIASSPKELQFLSFPSPDITYVKALFALMQRDLSCIYATFSSSVYEFLYIIETNWKKLVNDIRNGRLDKSISLSKELVKSLSDKLYADPARADELEAQFSKGFDTPVIPRIWPNMSMIACVGGSIFERYTKRIRKYSGSLPVHMAVYASSESMMAIPVDCEDTEYTPLTDGVFFEFRPVDKYGNIDEDTFYLLDELEAGRDYEVIITNMSGFYRYQMKDIIHIEGHYHNCPKGHITFRLDQIVSMVGEKVTPEDLDHMIDRLSEYVGVPMTDFALYPDQSISSARYILLIEPDPSANKGYQNELDAVADRFLRNINQSYSKYRDQGIIEAPLVYFLEFQTFALFRDMQIAEGASPSQIKPLRIIDTPKKERFFYALSDGPFKALLRLLYKHDHSVLGMTRLKQENSMLKKENEILKQELEKARNQM
ncbi:MAG: GH3 auxin-responsive promoter family protein [Lachnospiraceae bacterium]|nr:GH3 auxin-responsive promoter family protein [Lachnospiraceae bacterium]